MQIRFQTNGTALAVTDHPYVLTAGMAGTLTAVFDTDPLWAGLALTAVFAGSGHLLLAPLENGRCTVPHEVLSHSGTLRVGLFGTDGERTLPSVYVPLRVHPAVPTDGETAENYTPSLYEQFAARFARVENLTVSAEEGEAASVTADDRDGALHLAFTLPRGADAYTPVRGIDYWTEEDIAAIHGFVDDAILGGEW